MRFVLKDSLAYLRHKESGSFISCGNPSTLKNKKDLLSFEPALKHSMNDKLAIKISKQTIGELSDSNFLLSCKPYIRKYLILLKKLSQVRKEPTQEKPVYILRLLLNLNDKIRNSIECTRMLKDYCELRLLSENTLFQTNLISFRKQVIKKLDFIHLYCEILDNMFDMHDLDAVSVTSYQPITCFDLKTNSLR